MLYDKYGWVAIRESDGMILDEFVSFASLREDAVCEIADKMQKSNDMDTFLPVGGFVFQFQGSAGEEPDSVYRLDRFKEPAES